MVGTRPFKSQLLVKRLIIMALLGEHVFKLRRLPIAGGLVAALLILVMGIYWFITANFTQVELFSSLSMFIELFAVVLTILFGLGAAGFFGLLVLDLQNALVVNDDGLQFKSSFFTIAPIPWRTVEHIGLFSVENRDVYVVHIDKPRAFIDRHKGLLIRFALRVNHQISGSPIAVANGLLEVGEVNLFELLHKYGERYAA